LAGKHILLVEDDTDLLLVLFQVLEEAGYRVSTASRRDEAHRLLAGDIDLIVADSVLRGGNGDDVAKAGSGRGLPVIMISGEPGRIERLKSGPAPFLQKPFHAAELLRLIANLLA